MTGGPGRLHFLPSGFDSGSRRRRPRVLAVDEALVETAVEELPSMGRKDLKGALENLAAAHVPGPIDQYAMDYLSRRLPGGGRRAVMVIVRRVLLEEIRAVHPRTPIVVPEAAGRLNPENDSKKKGGRELFPPKGGRPVDRILAGALFLLIIGGALSLWTADRQSRIDRLGRDLQEDLIRRDSAAAREFQERLAALDAEWESLILSRPRRLSRLFDALARDAGAVINIRGFTVNDRRFSLRGEAADPLALAQSLEESPFFSEIRIADIRPDGPGGRQEFSLESLYHGP